MVYLAEGMREAAKGLKAAVPPDAERAGAFETMADALTVLGESWQHPRDEEIDGALETLDRLADFAAQNDFQNYALLQQTLDAHPELGNNAELCRIAGLADLTPCCNYHGLDIGFAGKFAVPTTLRELAARFGFEGTFYGDPDRKLCSATAVSGGGGQDALFDALERGADVLITGEFSHEMYHAVRESGLAVLPLGHYASETYGVRAVLKDLLKTFPLEGEFIDLPTGL